MSFKWEKNSLMEVRKAEFPDHESLPFWQVLQWSIWPGLTSCCTHLPSAKCCLRSSVASLNAKACKFLTWPSWIIQWLPDWRQRESLSVFLLVFIRLCLSLTQSISQSLPLLCLSVLHRLSVILSNCFSLSLFWSPLWATSKIWWFWFLSPFLQPVLFTPSITFFLRTSGRR